MTDAHFDLDRAVASWRQRMRAAHALLKDDLDELESHIRDHVDELVAEGASPRDAFFAATARVGSTGEVEREYRKVRFGRSKRARSLIRESAWSFAMLRNHLKTGYRSIARHKGFSAINLAGLAVGLAGCLLVSVYVRDELAYDKFHDDVDRIYRLGHTTIGWPYGRIVEEEFPEVEDLVYMRSYPTYSMRHDGRLWFEDMLYADAGFFRMFDFPLVDGDPEAALALPYSVVLSSSLAQRMFGDEPAVGKALMLDDSLRFTVTGVADVPRRSHIQFDALLSFETLRARDPAGFEEQMQRGWLNVNLVNYVRLREGADPQAFAAKVRDLPQERAGDYLRGWGSEYRLDVERADRIYLQSRFGNTLGPTSSMDYVYLLSAVGIFLLLIAAVNFINLSTARSADRAREVGVRKVVGSDRASLIRQFVGESVLMCTIAIVLAFGLVLVALPSFNDLTLKDYGLADLFTLPVAGTLVGLAIVVGVVAGLYPAFALSAYRPADVLKGSFATGRRGIRLRQGLVVLQFVISGALVLSTLVVMSQVRFMRSQDPGFDGEQVLVLDARRAPWQELSQRTETLKQELASHPAIERVSSAWTVPGRNGWRGQISFPEGWPEGESISLEYVAVDFDFIETMGLEVIAGRSFEEGRGADATEGVVINESAVAAAGWASPADAVGRGFTSPGSGKPNGVVIGVVADYHHHGLQQPIEPVMFGIRQGNGLIPMRFNASEAGTVVSHVERTWTRFFPDYPFDTFFLDEDFAAQYAGERRLLRVFGTFAALAIIIGCLGLFALAAFAAVRRTKEIGVRRVMGASVSRIAALLVGDFVKWVLLALLLCVPISYLAMSHWLSGFAYRTTLGLDLFIVGAGIVLAIAIITVGYTAVRAANTDPARSLRYE